jgi:hypothetical protein
MRDLNSIYAKLMQVVYPPKGGGSNELLRSALSLLSGFKLIVLQNLGSVGTAGDCVISGYRSVRGCESSVSRPTQLADVIWIRHLRRTRCMCSRWSYRW